MVSSNHIGSTFSALAILQRINIRTGLIGCRLGDMPFYLCEDCARDRVKLDLTYAGINQMWLRTSPNPVGFGPPCDFCNTAKTIYQVQIVGTKFDTENLHLEKMKAELKPTTP
jgi:hypothetical protein